MRTKKEINDYIDRYLKEKANSLEQRIDVPFRRHSISEAEFLVWEENKKIGNRKINAMLFLVKNYPDRYKIEDAGDCIQLRGQAHPMSVWKTIDRIFKYRVRS